MTNIDDCRVTARYPIIDAILTDQIKDPAKELTDSDKQMVTNILDAYDNVMFREHFLNKEFKESYMALCIWRVIPEVSGCDKLWEDIDNFVTIMRSETDATVAVGYLDTLLVDVEKLRKCAEEMNS